MEPHLQHQPAPLLWLLSRTMRPAWVSPATTASNTAMAVWSRSEGLADTRWFWAKYYSVQRKHLSAIELETNLRKV